MSRGQLLALGIGPQAIKRRRARARLHVVHRGVYVVGRPELSHTGHWMAAVLACGPGAVLSHGSAAALWGIGNERAGVIEVSVAGGRAPRPPGIRVHRRPNLGPRDLAEHERIPVTSPARTLVDLATRLKPAELESAINAADKQNLTDPETLRSSLAAFSGQPGVAALRTVLDRHTFTLTDSELERRFLPIAHAAGLPPPVTQAHLNGFRVDFYWPDRGLVVETDGLRYHRTPAQQARDRLRDQALTAAGLTPLRFSHAQVRYESGYVQATLARVARRLAGRLTSEA